MPQNKSSPKRITEAAAVNLTSIEWMLSVADHQSIRGAARALGVRQSAVSRRVSKLEDALGVSLFERSPRGVRMTNQERYSSRMLGKRFGTFRSRP